MWTTAGRNSIAVDEDEVYKPQDEDKELPMLTLDFRVVTLGARQRY